MDWDDDKEKSIMDLVAPQGMNPATQTMGIGAPPAGGSPPPPTVSPQEKPLAAAAIPDAEVPEGPSDETDAKTIDSHPLAQLPDYIKGQEQQVDKFGPDQQKAVLDMIQKEQGGLGARLGRAGTGFADAIMQGVARAGPGQFQKNFQENQNNQLDRQAAAIPQLQEMNAKNMAAKQALEGKSAATPLGAADAKAAQFLAKQLWPNISAQQLAAISQNPDALSKILPEGVDLKKALADVEASTAFRNAQLALQGATLANTTAHQKTDEELRRQEQALQHPIQNAVKGFMGGNNQNYTPDVTAYAQRHGITPARAQTVKDKRTGGK